MGTTIVNLKESWFEYSSISDTFVSCAMSREEMIGYLLWNDHADSWESWIKDGRMFKEDIDYKLLDISRRIERVDKKGSSSRLHEDAETALCVNRAGLNETYLEPDLFYKRIWAARVEWYEEYNWELFEELRLKYLPDL
ncbi:MAG: hypothetical protein CL489_10260 [Acidobacteria bacterium]|nr:hypothetical protein [Acidobacteriota bacterium]|tara:strand:+ start:6853 stop:7269 length:417 start_codon:yes stop_codon:yes gene_type:complete